MIIKCLIFLLKSAMLLSTAMVFPFLFSFLLSLAFRRPHAFQSYSKSGIMGPFRDWPLQISLLRLILPYEFISC